MLSFCEPIPINCMPLFSRHLYPPQVL